MASDLRSSTKRERRFLALYLPVVDLVDILLLDLDRTIDKPVGTFDEATTCCSCWLDNKDVVELLHDVESDTLSGAVL